MASDTPARGALLCHNETRNDCARLPPELARDLWREPHLRVDRPKKSLEIGDHRLDLDDEEGSGGGMKRQEIDAAAFAVSAEGDLDSNDPARSLEELLERCLEGRMTRVKEPIKLAAAPATVYLKVDVEGLADPPQGVDREPGGTIAFQLGDASPADSRTTGQINLAPAQA